MFAEQMLPRARERLATIGGEAPVKDAAALMSKPHTDLVVVCDREGTMVGVLTKTDIVGQITRCMGSGCTARVDTIMPCAVVSCGANEPLKDLWSTMKHREGGAETDGPQTAPHVVEGEPPVAKMGDAEMGALHVRVIALENLVIALLAAASDGELEAARNMASYISPRPGFTHHPLNLHAAGHMTDLIERAARFRAGAS